MKKKIAFIVLLLFSDSNLINAQTWEWAQHCGGGGTDGCSTICFDTVGNLYATGILDQPKGFFGNDTLYPSGLTDIFISKFDHNGNFMWSKRAGGDDQFSSEDMALMNYERISNSLILAGAMDATGRSIGSCNVGGGIFFLAKLDLDGTCIWTLGVSNYVSGYVTGMLPDQAGKIYIVGYLNFPGQVGGFSLLAGGFVAKFNSVDGSCDWAKNLGNLNVYPSDVNYFDGNLFISGQSINDTLKLDTATVYCNENDPFISRFDTSGKVEWIRTVGGSNIDIGWHIRIDGIGNIYAGGTFRDTAVFGNDTLRSGINKDYYFVKFDSSGNFIWVRQAHTKAGYAPGISVDYNGKLYASGNFSDTATFGTCTIIASNTDALFIVRLDSSGNCLGFQQVGGIRNGDIMVDNSENFYSFGGMVGAATFDSYSITSYGYIDAYIAKHDAITNIETEARVASNRLLIFANPNEGKCTVKIPDDFLHEKNLLLSIYDNSGKIIQQKRLELNEGKIKLNLQAEAKGIYNVTLSNGKKNYNGRIVFE